MIILGRPQMLFGNKDQSILVLDIKLRKYPSRVTQLDLILIWSLRLFRLPNRILDPSALREKNI